MKSEHKSMGISRLVKQERSKRNKMDNVKRRPDKRRGKDEVSHTKADLMMIHTTKLRRRNQDRIPYTFETTHV